MNWAGSLSDSLSKRAPVAPAVRGTRWANRPHRRSRSRRAFRAARFAPALNLYDGAFGTMGRLYEAVEVLQRAVLLNEEPVENRVLANDD
jgi:hypothetical protein